MWVGRGLEGWLEPYSFCRNCYLTAVLSMQQQQQQQRGGRVSNSRTALLKTRLLLMTEISISYLGLKTLARGFVFLLSWFLEIRSWNLKGSFTPVGESFIKKYHQLIYHIWHLNTNFNVSLTFCNLTYFTTCLAKAYLNLGRLSFSWNVFSIEFFVFFG